MRGLPDDFDGETITKTYKRRDNNTYIFTPGGSTEFFGADFGIGGRGATSFIYNTFNGLSLSQHFGVAASYVRNGNIKNERSKLCTGILGATFDSERGITPSFSFYAGGEKLRGAFNLGFNSKSGVFSFSNSLNFNNLGKMSQLATIGTSFSTAAELPPMNIPLTSRTFATAFQIGGSSNYVDGFGSVAASACIQSTPETPTHAPAYGLCYAHNGQKNERAVHDFNREKALHVNEKSQNLPLPVMTHDVYHVTGEQLVGSFRAFRNDFGHFFDNKVHNTANTFLAGVDYGVGNCAQIGANLGANLGFSVSSDWDSDYSDKFSFRDKKQFAALSNSGAQKQLYEPFYFQMSSEMTAQPLDYQQVIGGEAAVSFPIEERFAHTDFGVLHAQYSISDKLKAQHGSSFNVHNSAQPNRAKRTCSIEYEVGESSQEHRRANHISSFSLVNADGMRYTYGKTLYQILDKEVYFSIPHQNDVTSSISKHYSRENAEGTDRIGKEKLYFCTELPPYPYAYLLTEITAPDYVDANQNGAPDDADFGYWVKFNY